MWPKSTENQWFHVPSDMAVTIFEANRRPNKTTPHDVVTCKSIELQLWRFAWIFLADDTQGTARAATNQTKFLSFRNRKRSTQGESLVSDRVLNWPHTGFFTRRNWSATVVADNVARAATYRPTTHSHQVNKRSVLVTRSHHNLFTSLSHKLTWNQIKLTPLMCC